MAPVRIVVVGAGGHGKVVADALLLADQDVAGFLDDDPGKLGTSVIGLQVLGPVSWLEGRERGGYEVALAIGANHERSRLANRILKLGFPICSACHPSAAVAHTARIARGAAVLAGAVVNADASVGEGAIINSGAVVEHDAVVGRFAHVSPNATVGGEGYVGELAHLGIGATVLPRRRIGVSAVVGGGALVSRDVPPNVVAIGVPARVIRPCWEEV